MNTSNTKLASARAFVRSLNILLKFARLYGFDHKRTHAQFETAWNELHEAIPVTNEGGLLLGASGAQLLLDGIPVEATPAERSFAQLLSAAGLASIQFTSRVNKEDLERMVRAFPTQNAKPSLLAEQLKAALGEAQTIRINEIRFVPEDASKVDALGAGLLTAQSLGADADGVKDWLRDPQKLLQLIAAAEGSKGETGGSASGAASGRTENAAAGPVESNSPPTEIAIATPGPASPAGGDAKTGAQSPYSGARPDIRNLLRGAEAPRGRGTGTAAAGSSLSSGAGGSASQGARGPVRLSDTGSGILRGNTKDEDILGILKLLTHLGHTAGSEGGNALSSSLQGELTKLPPQSQEMMRQALAAVAAQTPKIQSNDPILLRLAEHLAIRFALERYERGEVKVNAVRQMIERMSQEIEGLRRILGVHEQKLAEAGVFVESSADLLDRQFWAAVPERSKRAVLTSPEAWCVPPRNIRQFFEELIQHGDELTALAILQTYASSVQSPEVEARRRTAIGLADLADLYASLGARALIPALQFAGAQLSLEREENLQGLISAAFVRLAQEAGLRRVFPAMLQVLDSLDSVENQRPVFAQSLRPRIGLEKRVPEFLDDALRGERATAGLEVLLQRVPRMAGENLVARFNRTTNRVDMQRLTDLAATVGNELLASLRDTLRSGSASEAAETCGLLSRLDVSCLERWLPMRLRDWPRQAQDRAVRLVAMGGAPERGQLLVKFLPFFDPVLLPLAIDEIGLSGDASCSAAIIRLAEGDSAPATRPFVRLKAVEALGRLKARESVELLRGIAEGRHMFHRAHPGELRLAAVQSLAKIDSNASREVLAHSGFGPSELSLAPLDPLPDGKYFRRRRYPRMRLPEPIVAIATPVKESNLGGLQVQPAPIRLEVRGLSLSGGIASGERHLAPGALVSLRIGTGLRPIRAKVLMRDARAQGLGFEFAEMELDERARLRKLLVENKSSTVLQDDAVLTQSQS